MAKFPMGEISCRRTVVLVDCPVGEMYCQRTFLSAKCPIGEWSRRWTVCRRTVHRRNVRVPSFCGSHVWKMSTYCWCETNGNSNLLINGWGLSFKNKYMTLIFHIKNSWVINEGLTSAVTAHPSTESLGWVSFSDQLCKTTISPDVTDVKPPI